MTRVRVRPEDTRRALKGGRDDVDPSFLPFQALDFGRGSKIIIHEHDG